MNKLTIKDIDINNKKVIIRVDFNVPILNNVITNDNRIKQALPTIKYALDNNAKVILLSHLGRIKTSDDLEKNSLRIVAQKLAELLDHEVMFINKTRGIEVEESINNMKSKEIIMLENTRFEDLNNKYESNCNEDLSKYWASLADIFVNDAFGTVHRSHASNVGISKYINLSVAGLLVEKELNFLGSTLDNPKRPLVAILGGAKVSDKIGVIKNLINIADYILIGGGMSYTFFKAMGYEIGTSLVEDDKLDLANELLKEANGKIILSKDIITTKEFSKDAKSNIRKIDEFELDDMGMDIGPLSIKNFKTYIKNAKTIIWNGPVGVFEFDNFSIGTRKIAEMIGKNKEATTIIGGGDSAAAVYKYNLENKFSHISTGGGASLEFLEGKKLPGIEVLNNK